MSFFKEHCEDFSTQHKIIESEFEFGLDSIEEVRDDMSSEEYLSKVNGINKERVERFKAFFFISLLKGVVHNRGGMFVKKETLVGKIKRETVKLLFKPFYLQHLAKKDRGEVKLKSINYVLHGKQMEK